MTVYCTKDGTAHPDDAMFCMQCGSSLRGGSAEPVHGRHLRWEYQEASVPLGIEYDERGGDFDLLRQHFNRRVAVYLNVVGRDGWQVEGPSDLESLEHEGRLVSKTLRDRGLLTNRPAKLLYESVTVRLKRLVD